MQQLVLHFAEALRRIDDSGEPFKSFQPGVGPYGEPQLMKKCTAILADRYPNEYKGIRTKRDPDVLVPNKWAIEAKLVRPFGDNGVEAEHWSQNLLHPYAGNVSALGDALKLLSYQGSERRVVLVIAFEHAPPRIDLGILLDAFEMVARQLMQIPLGERHEIRIERLVHPIHQTARVVAWEITGSEA